MNLFSPTFDMERAQLMIHDDCMGLEVMDMLKVSSLTSIVVIDNVYRHSILLFITCCRYIFYWGDCIPLTFELNFRCFL